ncbi:helix-hairpin-helix domain-containing protein [Bacillus sp. A116_S68]|nr:helix-hairpin-helix domain-containing protein [Bacillus sp. A116_S68]
MSAVFSLIFILTLVSFIIGLFIPEKVKATSRKQVIKFGFPAVILTLILANVVSAQENTTGLEEIRIENTALQSSLESSEEEIERLETKVEELEVIIEEQADIIEQDNKIASSSSNNEDKESLEKLEREIKDLNKEIEETEKKLKERENKITTLEKEMNDMTSDVTTSTQTETSSSASHDSCSPGSVRINEASLQELQAIHQIGPDRAEQIINLRSTPFRTYKDLTRVSGIADARVKEIEQQGIICFE